MARNVKPNNLKEEKNIPYIHVKSRKCQEFVGAKCWVKNVKEKWKKNKRNGKKMMMIPCYVS